MREQFISKVYYFFKKIYIRSGLNNIFFIRSSVKRIRNFILQTLVKRKKMILDPSDGWGTRIRILLNWYEPKSVAVSKKFLRPGMNVLDIGAHIGYFSILFSKLVGDKGHVFAFEPHPFTYKILKKNIRLSKFQNITAINKAISDSSGRAEFYELVGSARSGLYNVSQYLSEIDPIGYTLKRNYIIETITIDSFLSEVGNPEINFIKMDIEGAEPKALAGIKKTVARLKNLTMIVEFNPGTLQIGGVTPSEFINQLEEMGFKIKSILDSGGRIKTIEQLKNSQIEDGYVNLLCLKNIKTKQ